MARLSRFFFAFPAFDEMSASRPRTPSFLREDNDPPTYDFRRMDYYLVAGQGFEPEITVFERTAAYIEQLPSYVMTTLPNALPTAFELEVYLSDLSLAQAYYFRTGQPDQHQAWRQDWLRTCFCRREKLFYDTMVPTAATSVPAEIHVRRLFRRNRGCQRPALDFQYCLRLWDWTSAAEALLYDRPRCPVGTTDLYVHVDL